MYGYRVKSKHSDESGFVASDKVNFVDGDAEVVVIYPETLEVTVERLSWLEMERYDEEKESSPDNSPQFQLFDFGGKDDDETEH